MKIKQNEVKTGKASFGWKGKLPTSVAGYISTDLFRILVGCGIFRLIFYLSYNNAADYGDSLTYLNYSANIFNGEVDILRTPVYPYFIKIIKLTANTDLIENVVFAQAILSFLTIIVFYKIAVQLFQNRKVILTASVLYGIMPSFISFDKCILTESLSIDAIVIFLWLIVNYLRRPSIPKALLISTFSFFAIMLRPSFIILIPIVIFFWFMRWIFFKADRITSLSGIAASAVCILLLAGYSELNFKTNGYKGISVVSIINQLDVVINAEMYANGDDPEISETIKNNLSETHGAYNSMEIILFEKYSHERISKFIRDCILNQPGIYIMQGLKKTAEIGKSTTRTVYITYKGGITGKFMSPVSHLLSINFYIIYLLLLLDFIYIIVRWVRFHQILWIKIVLFMIITSQLAIMIVGAQGEYNRLFVVALPCVIIILFSYIEILIQVISAPKSNSSV